MYRWLRKNDPRIALILFGGVFSLFVVFLYCSINLSSGLRQLPPLNLAISHYDVTRAKALIQSGADVNARDCLGLVPLQYAVYINNRELVEKLLQKGADPQVKTAGGGNLLHCASQTWNDEIDPEILVLLINKGVNPNLQPGGAAGETPLHLMAVRKNYEGVKTLLEHGANPAIRSGSGDLFELAKKRKDERLLELLEPYRKQ